MVVDHKPLLKIFKDRSLDKISNSRLCNLKEKTLRYRFKIVHIPGGKNKTADATSRYPTGSRTEMIHLEDDVAAIAQSPHQLNVHPSFLAAIRTTDSKPFLDEELSKIDELASLNSIAISWNDVKEATASDEIMNELVMIIESGMPESKDELPKDLR